MKTRRKPYKTSRLTNCSKSPIRDRVPERWIDIINRVRNSYKIKPVDIAVKLHVTSQLMRDILNKRQYCSYSVYWGIHRALAELLVDNTAWCFEHAKDIL